MSAIVLDGQLKSALVTVRSLGRKAIPIYCGAATNTAMAMHSKYVTQRFVYPSPLSNRYSFADDVFEKAKTLYDKIHKKPVIYTFSDASSIALLRIRDVLSQVAEFPYPPNAIVDTASDKRETYAFAAALKVPVIKTFSRDEWSSVTYPAVVKYARSVAWRGPTGVRGSASFVFDREELESTYEAVLKKTDEEPLVMEFIKGNEYGVEMICQNGDPQAVFLHRRVRSLSPTGGAAAVKETAEENEQTALMRRYAKALVRELRWTGPVMVEFKIDDRDKSVKLMEINGRFWGSLPLAVAAGIDFPYLYYRLALKQALKSPTTFPVPFTRTVHFLGDLKWLSSVLFKNDRMRPLVYPSRVQAVLDVMTDFFRSSGDVFRLSDPKPAIMEVVDMLKKLT